MPVDNMSSRIPLPPLQTQELPVDVGEGDVKTDGSALNSKITPLSVKTQHVYVDCANVFNDQSGIGVVDESASSSNGLSARSSGSSIDRAVSSGVDGFDVPTGYGGSVASGKSLSNSMSAVNVVVRVRPEVGSHPGSTSVVSTVHQGDVHQVMLNDPSRDGPGPFTVQVDAALPTSSTQSDVFNVVGWPMVDHCMDGFNSTIFAYGQTGSGKTHTMMGDIQDERQAGLIPRVFASLFEAIRAKACTNGEDKDTYTISCSFLEIYNEEVIDLLDASSTNLQIRDGDVKRGVYVQGLSTHRVESLADVLQLIAVGSENRKIASTELNERSSRSHSVFTAKISWEGMRGGVRTVRSSKLNLVDLAGSERVRKSGATGEQLVEARSINRSLSVLGRVISRLMDKQGGGGGNVHVPYRDSKLTFLLQESLGGNSKTAVVATVNPSACSAGETYCTLVFAAGAKKIKCQAVVNENQLRRDSLNEETIRALQEENARLRSELDESRVEAEMAESARMRGMEDNCQLKKVETLERELEEIRMLFDQNSAVIGMLRAEQSIIQRELVESKATAQRATQEASTLRASNVSLSNAFEALEEENSRLQGALESLQEQFVHENGELEQAKTDMAKEIERLAADAEREACSLRKKLEDIKAARKKEVADLETKMVLLEKDLAHSNDKASSFRKLMDDAAEYKAAADSSKVEIKMLKEKMAELKEEYKLERQKLVADLDVARRSERASAEGLAMASLEKQQLAADVESLRKERERMSKENEDVVEGLKKQIEAEKASVAKYKRMVGEISKLVDWAQSNQAGSAAAAAAALAASNENNTIKPSPAAQAALRVARMSLSTGGWGNVLRESNSMQ